MTPNKEDYLKAIYACAGGTGLASNKRLAQALRISPASVSEMLPRLQKEGLITYTPYKGSQLTEKGGAALRPVLRGHALWEAFLVQCLGYAWQEAHEDAHLLEHATTGRLLARLDAFLAQSPQDDPRGDAHQPPAEMPLSALGDNEAGEIIRIQGPGPLPGRLCALGLRIGSRLRRHHDLDSGNGAVYAFGEATIALRAPEAGRIYITPVHCGKGQRAET